MATLCLTMLAPAFVSGAPPAGTPARASVATLAPAAEAYQRECGECHVAYPPRLLAAQDWRRIVETLDRHFGVDATLEPSDLRVVAAWLDSGAGRPRYDGNGRAAAPLPRITTGAWFRREHDEIGAAIWGRPEIRSPSRCEACHVNAAQGRFDEGAIRTPR